MTAPTNTAHDDRLDVGMQRQQDLLRAAEAEGARQAGWKAGFGTSAWRGTFGLDAPLVGFLLDRTAVEPGATVALGAWGAPRAEAELALRLAEDVDGDAGAEAALAAVGGLAPAIELVDLTPAPEDPATVLAGNIFHRHWVTGDFTPMPTALGDLVGRVAAMGERLDDVHDVEAATGRAGDVLAEVARMAARHGRGLRAGDVVILGSILPPVAVGVGGTFRYELGEHPALEVSLSA